MIGLEPAVSQAAGQELHALQADYGQFLAKEALMENERTGFHG